MPFHIVNEGGVFKNSTNSSEAGRITGDLKNAGSATLAAGILQLEGAVTGRGEGPAPLWTWTAPGVIQLSNNQGRNLARSAFSGTGTLLHSAGTTTLGGPYDLASVRIEGGALIFNQPGGVDFNNLTLTRAGRRAFIRRAGMGGRSNPGIPGRAGAAASCHTTRSHCAAHGRCRQARVSGCRRDPETRAAGFASR